MTEDQYASPACAIAQAGDVYLGYAGPDELIAVLLRLRAVVEEPWRSMLMRHLAGRQGAALPDIAPLLGTEVPGLLRRLLPRVRNDQLHADLKALLKSYEAG